GGVSGLPERLQSTVPAASDSVDTGTAAASVNCATRASNARNRPEARRVSRIIGADHTDSHAARIPRMARHIEPNVNEVQVEPNVNEVQVAPVRAKYGR